MRAIRIRPALFRRNSTSLTVMSNFAAGLYAVAAPALAARAGKPAAPSTVISLRKSRRPRACMSIRTSLHDRSGRDSVLALHHAARIFSRRDVVEPDVARHGAKERDARADEHRHARDDEPLDQTVP